MRETTPSIGIIGCGFVGSAILNGFKYYTEVKVYDKFKENLDSLEDVVSQNVLFVCVPTPEGEDGSCDTGIVREVLLEVNSAQSVLSDTPCKPVIIKSTIPPGFCATLQAECPSLEIIHSPEFLTERIAGLDFATQTRVILGRDRGVSQPVLDLFRSVFPGIQVMMCPWDVAALVKYGLNTFFAAKISFFNELKQICDALGVDFSDVAYLMKNDGRISRHHMDVPGHDGKLGFGGACFPKDISALISVAKAEGVDPKVLEAAATKNAEVRKRDA
jgi:UDPglucose 6-dehydrogenase